MTTARGRKPHPQSLRILALYEMGLCNREIAAKICVPIKAVQWCLHVRGHRGHIDPLFPHRYYQATRKKESEENRRIRLENRTSPVDALVLTGEPDRRAKCYRVFEMGGSDEQAKLESGADIEEVKRFRSEMPEKWSNLS